MASKKIVVLFVAIAYLLFTDMNCNKGIQLPQTQADVLPLETQEGKNTFGCYWNDTLWLPIDYPMTGPKLDAVFYKDLGYVLITASQNKINTYFSLVFFNTNAGIYSLDTNCYIVSKSNNYYKGLNGSIKLQLTKFIKPINNQTGIVSAKFSGVFYRIFRFGTGIKDSFDLKDSIKITKGVFDVQLR